MKQLLKIFFVLIGLVVLWSSCHKYPKDPFISLRNPDDRLKGSTWKFTSFQINGVEHSHDFDSFLSPHTLTDVTFQFDEKGQTYIITNIESQQIAGNNYKWSSDSKNIWLGVLAGISVTLDSIPIKFARNVLQDTSLNTYWIVEELYNNDFHISRNGTDIYFKKQ